MEKGLKSGKVAMKLITFLANLHKRNKWPKAVVNKSPSFSTHRVLGDFNLAQYEVYFISRRQSSLVKKAES